MQYIIILVSRIRRLLESANLRSRENVDRRSNAKAWTFELKLGYCILGSLSCDIVYWASATIS